MCGCTHAYVEDKGQPLVYVRAWVHICVYGGQRGTLGVCVGVCMRMWRTEDNLGNVIP